MPFQLLLLCLMHSAAGDPTTSVLVLQTNSTCCGISCPRYKNDNNRKTHVESTRAMTRERGARAESKNFEILLFPTADRRFDTKVKCPTGRASFWVKFPTVRSLTRVNCPGIARAGGGKGGFGIDWYITRSRS